MSARNVVAEVFAFVAGLPASEAARFDLETEDGFAAAWEAYQASQVSETNPGRKSGDRTPKVYKVILLKDDGTFEILGSGRGSVGRESQDPSKWSDLQKIRARGELRILRLAAEGIKAEIISVPEDELTIV